MAFVQHFFSTPTCRRFIMNQTLHYHHLHIRSFPKLDNLPRLVRINPSFYPSRLSINNNNNALGNVFNYAFRYECIGRMFSTLEVGVSEKNNVVNKPYKNWKRIKAAAAARKRSLASVGVNVTEEKTGSLDAGSSLPLNGTSSGNDALVSDTSSGNDAGLLVSESKQMPKHRSKVKRKPQGQTGVSAGETVISSGIGSNAKNSTVQISPVEINGTSSIITEAMEGGVSTISTKKPKKKSAKKGNSVTNATEELTPSHMTRVAKSQGKKTWPQLYPPIAKSVLIVESVTKAKVIQGYLGQMFEVLPSYGHVRDLAARSGSVRPGDDFNMVWEVPTAAWSHLKSIKVALSGADNLILASDPDREGEAIAWHLIEMLQQQGALHENVTVARVVFNEITESSIKTALQNPREIDVNLVHAYLARRALDYLIGFNVSPLLWRKLPGCQSAGRVQSAALALIVDREKEIEELNAQEYWTVDVEFHKKDPNSSNFVSLTSRLTHFDDKKLDRLSVSSVEEAKDIEEKIKAYTFVVVDSKTTKTRRNPPAPYITSTLQQDAANRLNFTASQAMKVAQKLYEGITLSDGKTAGLITYVRTDGLHLSDEAANDIHSFVKEKYGHDFASKVTRKYFKKVKNAQEAHEAIRPTNIRRLPSSLVGVLDEDSLKLYSLIWSRTMACQMECSIIGQIQVEIRAANQSAYFRSTCSRVEFLGHKAAYVDADNVIAENDKDEEKNRNEIYETLSNIKSHESLCLSKVEVSQHYTQPPPRYSEASLVKKLEELGIGRPSTYATTINVLKDRGYIKMENRTVSPEFLGRIVSAFLSNYFSEVSDYCFTADMETELDNVSAGMTEWKGLLRDYWTRLSKYCERAGNLPMAKVEKMLEKTFEKFFFSFVNDEDRSCPSCTNGTLVFKVGRYGPEYFIACDQDPKCKYIAITLHGKKEDPDLSENSAEEPKLLGLHPGSNEKVLLKCGPYSNYVQLGEDSTCHRPKRASVSRIKDVNSITLEVALDLLRYPVTLGNHPVDDRPVIIKLAKAGFSVKHRRSTAPVPKNLKAKEITMEKALKLLKGKDVTMCGRPKNKKNVEESVEA